VSAYIFHTWAGVAHLKVKMFVAQFLACRTVFIFAAFMRFSLSEYFEQNLHAFDGPRIKIELFYPGWEINVKKTDF